jgi:hypothetical protein
MEMTRATAIVKRVPIENKYKPVYNGVPIYDTWEELENDMGDSKPWVVIDGELNEKKVKK